MNILHRRILVFAVALTMGGTLIACDSGGGADTPSPEEVRTQVQNASTDLSTTVQSDLVDGEFGTVAQDLFGGLFGGMMATTLDGDIGGKSQHGFLFIQALDDQDIFQTSSDGRFEYDASTGEYTWNPSDQRWAEAGSSENIVLRFPTQSAESEETDGTFTLGAYSGVEVGSEFLPEQIDASLAQEGPGTIFSLGLGGTNSETARYRSDPSPVPTDIQAEVLTAPLLHTFSLTSPSTTQFNFSFSLENDESGDFVAGLSADVALNTTDYADVEAADVDAISGSVDLSSDLSIAYTLDVDGLDDLGDDPSPEAINEEIETASIQIDGQEVATLEYGTAMIDVPGGQAETETLLVIYSDGSKDPAIEVFGPLFGLAGNMDLNAVTSSLPEALLP